MLHRALLRADGLWPGFVRRSAALEQSFVTRVEAALADNTAERRRVTESCWQEAAAAEIRWLHALREAATHRRRGA